MAQTEHTTRLYSPPSPGEAWEQAIISQAPQVEKPDTTVTNGDALVPQQPDPRGGRAQTLLGSQTDGVPLYVGLGLGFWGVRLG